MCIICNLEPDNRAADDFLQSFADARAPMKDATAAMAICAKTAIRPEDRKRYASIHKRMVRLCWDWNRIEHLREKTASPQPQA